MMYTKDKSVSVSFRLAPIEYEYFSVMVDKLEWDYSFSRYIRECLDREQSVCGISPDLLDGSISLPPATVVCSVRMSFLDFCGCFAAARRLGLSLSRYIRYCYLCVVPRSCRAYYAPLAVVL